MANPPADVAPWLAAARAGSREALGPALEACRRALAEGGGGGPRAGGGVGACPAALARRLPRRPPVALPGGVLVRGDWPPARADAQRRPPALAAGRRAAQAGTGDALMSAN